MKNRGCVADVFLKQYWAPKGGCTWNSEGALRCVGMSFGSHFGPKNQTSNKKGMQNSMPTNIENECQKVPKLRPTWMPTWFTTTVASMATLASWLAAALQLTAMRTVRSYARCYGKHSCIRTGSAHAPSWSFARLRYCRWYTKTEKKMRHFKLKSLRSYQIRSTLEEDYNYT